MANYTRKAILNNFEQMLEEMPFDKLTVSALVVRCDISSNTFYYHFRDIYDLLDTWLAEKKGQYLEEAEALADWPARMKLILRKLKSSSKSVYHVFNSISRERIERFVFVTLQKDFYDIIKSGLGERVVSEDTVQDLASFCCYSSFGFFLKFLWDQMEADIDEGVDRLAGTFFGVTEYVIAKSQDIGEQH